jgi:hypothetical protein
MRYPLLLAALASCGIFSSSTANAYWWNGAGVGIGGLYQSLDYPTETRVPYFAAHPPVYYSTPVPRTYGYSPFAYPPDVRTPEVAGGCVVQPAAIINPYVPSSTTDHNSSEGAAPANKTTSKTIRNRTISNGEGSHGEAATQEPTGPMTIINPFVSSPSRTI